ncbi:hypothetical protein Hanom_Chr05g00444871 [Helianthus anomalus]
MFLRLLPVNLKSFSKTCVVSDSSSGLMVELRLCRGGGGMEGRRWNPNLHFE